MISVGVGAELTAVGVLVGLIDLVPLGLAERPADVVGDRVVHLLVQVLAVGGLQGVVIAVEVLRPVTLHRVGRGGALLLDDVRHLVRQQRRPGVAIRDVGATAEEDVLADGERARAQRPVELVGAVVGVQADTGEVGAERPLQRRAHRLGDRPAAGACQPDGPRDPRVHRPALAATHAQQRRDARRDAVRHSPGHTVGLPLVAVTG